MASGPHPYLCSVRVQQIAIRVCNRASDYPEDSPLSRARAFSSGRLVIRWCYSCLNRIGVSSVAAPFKVVGSVHLPPIDGLIVCSRDTPHIPFFFPASASRMTFLGVFRRISSLQLAPDPYRLFGGPPHRWDGVFQMSAQIQRFEIRVFGTLSPIPPHKKRFL